MELHQYVQVTDTMQTMDKSRCSNYATLWPDFYPTSRPFDLSGTTLFHNFTKIHTIWDVHSCTAPKKWSVSYCDLQRHNLSPSFPPGPSSRLITPLCWNLAPALPLKQCKPPVLLHSRAAWYIIRLESTLH